MQLQDPTGKASISISKSYEYFCYLLRKRGVTKCDPEVHTVEQGSVLANVLPDSW